MKPAETEAAPVTTQSSQWSQRLRWWAAFFRGSEAPFGFSLREWTVLGIVIYMGFLLVQFGLGMGINLFIPIPEHHPGAGAPNFVVGFVETIVWGIAHGPLLLAIHIVVGLIVLVHPIMVAVQLPPFVPSTRWPTVVAALCVVAAAASGAAYLTYHQDVFSLLMALGFGGAMLCYAITLYLVSRSIGTTTVPASLTPPSSGMGQYRDKSEQEARHG